jgi:hypothetical protein
MVSANFPIRDTTIGRLSFKTIIKGFDNQTNYVVATSKRTFSISSTTLSMRKFFSQYSRHRFLNSLLFLCLKNHTMRSAKASADTS